MSEGLEVAMGTHPHIWWLNLNHNERPFSDVRVRQAVNHAIDKAGMAEKLLRGTSLPAFSMVSRTSVAFDSDWEDPYSYDPDRARALLAEAGYPDGFETTLQTSTAGSGQILPVQMAEWIQRDLAKVGIRASIETFEWNTYVGIWVNGLQPGQGINQISWGTNSDFWLVHPLAADSPVNSGAINDPVIEDLLERMQRARGPRDPHRARARGAPARARAGAQRAHRQRPPAVRNDQAGQGVRPRGGLDGGLQGGLEGGVRPRLSMPPGSRPRVRWRARIGPAP